MGKDKCSLLFQKVIILGIAMGEFVYFSSTLTKNFPIKASNISNGILAKTRRGLQEGSAYCSLPARFGPLPVL